MGLFLSMSGVVGGSEDSVVGMLRAYAEDHEGSLHKEELTVEQSGCLVVSESTGGVTVVYPRDFFGWDDATKYLSKCLRKPVFSFHIHDSDFWMYVLYENGEAVDQFNPVPDYWGDLEEDEQEPCTGNATEVARRVPGLAPEQIARYLVQWGVEVFGAAERRKAYPTDQFCYGDDYQLIDFMGKLGLEYPFDDRGGAQGATYRFECKSVDFS